jgi:hypothetical protein
MALTDDERTLLEKLTQKAKEPDAPDHEIEIYDTKKGVGARLPFTQGAKWLFETFGIGDAPAAPEQQSGGTGAPAGGQGGGQGGGQAGGNVSYFGNARRTSS